MAFLYNYMHQKQIEDGTDFEGNFLQTDTHIYKLIFCLLDLGFWIVKCSSSSWLITLTIQLFGILLYIFCLESIQVLCQHLVPVTPLELLEGEILVHITTKVGTKTAVHFSHILQHFKIINSIKYRNLTFMVLFVP